MSTSRRLAAALAAVILLGAGAAGAQTRAQAVAPQAPATIKGRIFDAESGEPMPYTNVFLSGTNLGTMAFTDGFYILRGLRPGTYTVKASYISYEVGQKTVTLGPGEVVDIDFRLLVKAIMTEPMEIAAERALVEVDRTGSAHFLSARAMEAMPLDDVVNMLAQQPGVTLQDNEIHIRGGRADDTQFVVDGLSVNDPLVGGGYGYNIDPSIINEIEVLTGGFNAEYGQAVSGVVRVTTKEGSDRLEGRASLQRDYFVKTVDKREPVHWRDLTRFEEPHNIDIAKLSLSGPDPLSAGLRALGLDLPGKQYLLASGSMDIRDGYLPIHTRQSSLRSPVYDSSFWSPRTQNDWNGMVKWTWHVTPTHKLNINTSRQVAVSQGFTLPGEGYPRPYLDNMDSTLVFTNENILTQVYWRQVLSETAWYELTVGRNFARMHANLNGNDDFRSYSPAYVPSRGQDGQRDGHDDRWHDHYVDSWTGKGTWSFMGGAGNEFKTGFDLSFTEMQMVDLSGKLGDPDPGTLANREDIFVAHPVSGAAFFQDTARYRGLVVNAGVRVDFWAPGKEVEQVMANPDRYLFIFPGMPEEFEAGTVPFAGRRWKTRLSPRLGLSFPVTERDKFFFNYGHFSQWPRFAYVYPQLQTTTVTQVPLLGNPNLDPKVTVEYEAGVQHEFGGLWSLGLTFFNRDIYDYAKSVTLAPVTIDPDDTPDPSDDDQRSEDIQPVRYFNGDSARSLGIELSVVKRTTRWLSGSASLEMQRTTGTNSSAEEEYLQRVYGPVDGTQPTTGGLTRDPLLWDKPWAASVNLDFTVFDKDRPELFGWVLPANWSANLLLSAEAGQRYTPRIYVGPRSYTDGDRYSEVGPWTSSVNLRLSKFWKTGRNEKLTIWLEARNLLNHKNYRRVNPWTGDGYKLGDYNPSWSEQWEGEIDDATGEIFSGNTDSEAYAKSVVDPSYLENPRVVMWGVSYSW
ncbi:MAG: TonB-dependent receptor [Candidatus Krumholzibacteriia bacterium]